jgi:hypothetical protein
MSSNVKTHRPAALPSLVEDDTLSGWGAAAAMLVASIILLLVMTA